LGCCSQSVTKGSIRARSASTSSTSNSRMADLLAPADHSRHV
jgi:hypothetical protein